MNEAAHRLAALIVLVGLLASCSRTEPASISFEPQDRVENHPVVVTIVDRAGYDAVLVSLKGKVVLVDCWASWCLPCLEQLPHTLELAERHRDKLSVVTLSFDDPSKSEQIGKVLNSKGGKGVGNHLVSQHGGSTESMDEFEITGGALPHYKLYDRGGTLRRTFGLDPSTEKQFTTADIDEAVYELLDEPL